MHAATFDTLFILEKLTQNSVFTQPQAKAVVEVLKEVEQINMKNAATKKDIKESELILLSKITETEYKIKQLESAITIKVYFAMGAMATFLCTAIPLIIKHF